MSNDLKCLLICTKQKFGDYDKFTVGNLLYNFNFLNKLT